MRHQSNNVALSQRSISPRESSGPVIFPLGFHAADSRTDSGIRHVRIETSGIVLDREVSGIKMRIFIPIERYRGVALQMKKENSAAPCVSVILLHQDRSLDVVLFEARNDQNVTAEWDYWAKNFGLPMIVLQADGASLAPFPRLGALSVEAARPRRRLSHLSKRRPRFLTRRGMGRHLF